MIGAYEAKVAKDAVPVLIETLQDPNKEIRSMAVRILGDIGQLAFSAIADLTRMLREEKDKEIQEQVKETLRRIKRE